jgi:hypothetical protein
LHFKTVGGDGSFLPRARPYGDRAPKQRRRQIRPPPAVPSSCRLHQVRSNPAPPSSTTSSPSSVPAPTATATALTTTAGPPFRSSCMPCAGGPLPNQAGEVCIHCKHHAAPYSLPPPPAVSRSHSATPAPTAGSKPPSGSCDRIED